MIETLNIDLLVLIAITILLGAILQGLSGFGLVLLAVPLLATFMLPQVAVPVASFASLAAALMMIFQYRAHCNWVRVAWLGIPALLLSPFGVYLLTILNTQELHLLIGIVLIGSTTIYFGSKLIIKAENSDYDIISLEKMSSRLNTVCIGAVSGILGGTLGMTGPLLANHLIKTGIRREEFKATLNLIFVLSASWRICLYFVQDVMTGQTLILGLFTLPVTIIGILIGQQLGKLIKKQSFVSFIHLLIALIGIWQLIEALGS